MKNECHNVAQGISNRIRHDSHAAAALTSYAWGMIHRKVRALRTSRNVTPHNGVSLMPSSYKVRSGLKGKVECLNITVKDITQVRTGTYHEST